MIINLMETNNLISVNLESLLNADGYTCVSVYLSHEIADIMAGETYTAIISSYPIYKNDHCYDLTTEIEFNRRGYFIEVIHDIIYPMAKLLYAEYKKIVENTENVDSPFLLNECRAGDEYDCLHSFDNIVAEIVTIDTENKTIEIVCGS